MSLTVSLAAVGAILATATLVGRGISVALLPADPAFRAERWGWSVALGATILAAATAAALAWGARPGWLGFAWASVIVGLLAWRLRLPRESVDLPIGGKRWGWITAAFALLLVIGIVLYLLRALTEPMWSNDYLAIWGLKAKIIFFTRRLPQRFLPEPLYGFSHPEYPLGLPLLLAGVCSLLGRWDDHAVALLFPLFQIATLAALWGWLTRRGVRWPLPLAAAALLSLFEPLYSGFLTGLAEVPLSCVFLLFGTAFSDALDGDRSSAGEASANSGALRRLATASILAAGLKNEGLLLAAVGAVGALIARRRDRWRMATCAFLPAAVLAVLGRVLSGNAPLRDFDFGLIARPVELAGRLTETVRAAISGVVWPAAPGILCLVLLFAAGRRTPFADRLLGLAAALWICYFLIPMFAVAGPAWLVSTSLARTSAALAPLAAAGLTARLPWRCAGAASAAEGDPRASGGHDGSRTLSTPAS